MITVPLVGGLNESASPLSMAPGELVACLNMVPDRAGGYSRIGGVQAFDGRSGAASAVPGEGAILGIGYFNGAVIAARNAVGGASSAIYRSSPAGWVAIKTGLPAGGVYRFRVGNIEGSAGKAALYGVSGTRKGFRISDAWAFSDVTTGMTTDTPAFLAIHSGHLFYAFPGGSLQHSSENAPLTWQVATGAAEIALPDEITGLHSHRGVLIVRTASSMHQLSGNNVGNWNLALLASVGSPPDLAVSYGDDLLHAVKSGVQALQATAAYGDFASANLAEKISRSAELFNAGSCVLACRETGSVRWFCGATTLYLAVGHGWGVVRYPFTATCAVHGAGGKFVGAADGFVYQLDTGTTFAGQPIDWFARLAPFNAGDNGQRKRFKRVALEISSPVAIQAGYVQEFDYGAVTGQTEAFNVPGNPGARFDTAAFDSATFDSASELMRLTAHTCGTGFAMSMHIGGSGSTPPFRISAISYDVSARRKA